MEVEEKIAEMQKYIPCLKLLIGNLEKNPTKEEQVKKMQYLLEMLTKKDSSIKLETLTRCEGILMKVYGKEKMLSNTAECNGAKEHSVNDDSKKNHDAQNDSPEPIAETVSNGNSAETLPKIVSVSGNVSTIVLNDKDDLNTSTNGIESAPVDANLEKDKDNKSSQDCIKEEEPCVENSDKLLSPEGERLETAKDVGKESTSNGTHQIIVAEAQNAVDILSKPTNDHVEVNAEMSEPSTRDDNNANGESDMEIDMELTNSDVAKSTNAEQLLTVDENKTKADTGEANKNESESAKPAETDPITIAAPKSSVVDLTSDDSNDEAPTKPQASQTTLQTKTVSTVVMNNQSPCKLQIVSSITPEKSSVVYLLNNNTSSTFTPKLEPPSVPSTAPKDPLEDALDPKIMTIVLDSDSDDEGDPQQKTASVEIRNLPDPNGQITMPTPKFDKPMFTIASVQSINTLQAHQDKRREVEKELLAIVQSVQYTGHHTVPQKYNSAVRMYLENFVKDLMFEKTRVNLCLQKLQKALDLEKYKQVKRIIQTYCSEPVDDPTLPAPSPFCHRIKVYPEKLQFVMKQLFFFHSVISVIGYKVYSLVPQNHKVNGVTASPVPSSGAKNISPVTPPGPPRLLNKRASQTVAQPLKIVAPAQATFAIATQASTTVRKVYPSMAATKSVCVTMHATPANSTSTATPSLSSALPLPLPSALPPTSSPLPSSSNDNLLAPMKTQTVPVAPTPAKPRRRRRRSDDDDEDDENYVPQGYLSESDEASETSNDATTRRTSLQRASKLRCQKYLELERAIDDETYIRATEATIANALKGSSSRSSSTSSSQPPAKKPKSTPRPKKKETVQAEEEAEGTNPEDDELDDEDDVRPSKRKRKYMSDDQDMDDNDEDEDDTPPLDTSLTGEGMKNVHRAVHCRSKHTKRCMICCETLNMKCIVSHYVNNHRDREVFCSRITKNDIMKLQSETMCFAFLSASKGAINTYVAYCIFCQQEQCLSLTKWWEHYTRHTGEYVYGCSSCGVRRSCRAQINRHVKVECSQKGSTLVELNELDPNMTRIVAYVCLLCYYIQLEEGKVLMHMQTEHEFPGSVHELPEGVYQGVNLLSIEQNFYEGGEQGEDSTVLSAGLVAPSTDDMSFMICNMLATGQEQTTHDEELAAPGTEVDKTAGVMIPEFPSENPSQSPETIIPESIPADDSATVVAEGDVPTEKNEETERVDDSEKMELSSEDKELDSTTDDLPPNSLEFVDLKEATRKEGETFQELEAECEAGQDVLKLSQASDDAPVPDPTSSDKPANLIQDTIENALTTDSNPALSLDTPEDEMSKQSITSEDDDSAEATDERMNLTADEEDLTRSATETIFQRVTTSLIDLAYEAVEVVSRGSRARLEPPETTTISSESTSDMPESVESEPEFLNPTEKSLDESEAIVATELIVPDLEVAAISEPTDELEAEDAVDCDEADDEVSKVLPVVDAAGSTSTAAEVVVEKVGGEVFEIVELNPETSKEMECEDPNSSNQEEKIEVCTTSDSLQERADEDVSEGFETEAKNDNSMEECESVQQAVEAVTTEENLASTETALVEEMAIDQLQTDAAKDVTKEAEPNDEQMVEDEQPTNDADEIDEDELLADVPTDENLPEDILLDSAEVDEEEIDRAVAEDIPKDTNQLDSGMTDKLEDEKMAVSDAEQADDTQSPEKKAADENVTEKMSTDAVEAEGSADKMATE